MQLNFLGKLVVPMLPACYSTLHCIQMHPMQLIAAEIALLHNLLISRMQN
jgi:hypothetical protein